MNERKLARPDASEFRRHWQLAPGITFLNHGSFGACPTEVLALQTELRRRMEAEPVQFLWRHYDDLLGPSRQAVAEFIGGNPRDLVFVTNATTAVNAVVNSLVLRPGDELLTTNLDYNACHNVLVEKTRRSGAKLVTCEIPFPIESESEAANAILGSVTWKTRLVMLDHVTSNTGIVLPVERIVGELEGRGIETLVDGAHAPGMLPLNLEKLRPSYYTGNLHKWVCAPKGAAFLWVREDKQAELQPSVISHGHNTPRLGFSKFQDRFDWAGTFDPSAWLCAGKALEFMGGLVSGGWSEIQRRNRELAAAARRDLCEALGVRPPCPEDMLGAMATLPLPSEFQGIPRTGKIDSEQLRLYDEFGIEAPFVRFGQPEARWFRISCQIYNSKAEYEYLGEALVALGAELARA